jgi:hypothetical protein
MRPNARRLAATTVVATLLTADLACAQTPAAASFAQETDDELSKDTENPVTLRITLPLRYEADFDNGAYRDTKDSFLINQAVVPFLLNDDWALITRTKLPGYVQPPKKVGDHWESGLGNGYTTFFLSPARGNGFYWGAGPVLYYPTATNAALGVNKWGSGPSAAFVFKRGDSPWVVGAIANNIWSFGGPPGSSDRTNSLLLNPFISYHLGDGWSIGSSPSIAANWLAKTGQKWTVPVGGGISKTFRLGGQPMKLSVDSYYNAVRPQSGNDTWLLQFTLTFLFAT